MKGKGANAMFEKVREDIVLGAPSEGTRDTRFKQGVSGNPRGRPRKESTTPLLADQPTKQAILRASRQKLTVREGDRTTVISASDAVVKTAVQTALKGSPYMQHRFLEWNMKAEQDEARQWEQSRAAWAAYKEQCHDAMQAERAEKREPSKFLPHPDDVVINLAGPVRFIGPWDEASEKAMEQTIAIRDLLILQEEWDWRSQPEPALARDAFLGSAKLFSIALDRSLPPRLRHSDVDWFIADERARCMPSRVLLKELYQGWRTLGIHRARGYRFPDRNFGEKWLTLVHTIGRRFPMEEASSMSDTDLQEGIFELTNK